MLKVKAIYVEMEDTEGKIWSTDFYGKSASKGALTEVKACITVRKWKTLPCYAYFRKSKIGIDTLYMA